MSAQVPLDPVDPAKLAAARAAVELVEDGMVLGFGTGSTVEPFLRELAARRLDVSGIPTSSGTKQLCDELGLTTLEPSQVDVLDLAIDGADELTRDLVLTKGGGRALLREKVVASMALRFVVIATSTKLVERLAEHFPLPVEVVPFAVAPVRRLLEEDGFTVTVRTERDGREVRTDNGNVILDARIAGGLEDPATTDVWLTMIPGVACSGLFVDMAEQALLGRADGSVDVLDLPR
jgi:ribose 5-phosphate isomerase A